LPVTCDEDHNYNDEQAAADGGLMDKFVEKLTCNEPKLGPVNGPASVMGYYDGNTVTAMWNYAQHFADERQTLAAQRLGVYSGRSQPRCRKYFPWNSVPHQTERQSRDRQRKYRWRLQPLGP